MVSSRNGTPRIRVATDLTLLKRVLADRTGKFKRNSWRDDSIWCITRFLKGTRDRTRVNRNGWWRWSGLFTYFWMFYNVKVNIQSICDIENAMNYMQRKILWSSPKGENPRLHRKLHTVMGLSNSQLIHECGHGDQHHMKNQNASLDYPSYVM